MPDMSFSEGLLLRNSLLQNRSPYLNKWRTAGELMSPNSFNEYAIKNDGRRKDKKIINNTARRSLRTFQSGMMNGGTSRVRPWFELVTLNDSITNSTEAKRYFKEVEGVFNSRFQISNLYRVLPTAYKDVGTYSNAAYAMLPHERFGFYFYPFAIGSYCIANDSEGNVTTFMREFTLSVRQVVERYGELKPNGHIDFSKLGGYIENAWKRKEYLNEVTLVNIILPNSAPKENPLFSKDKPYQSYTYVLSYNGGTGSNQVQSARDGGRASGGGNTSLLSGQFISVKGYDYFPVICPRWEVEAEADWGSGGPGEIATGDVQTLQELEKGRLNAIDKLLRPAMVGPSSMRRHGASILAGGLTYLDVNDKINQFRPAFTVDPKIAELIGAKVDYESAIKSAFFEDLFLMLSNERTVSHVTARQIDEQAAEKLSALGPVMGQLDHDQGRPLIDNAFIILGAQEGVLPKKPKILENKEIRPEYISILAQAQKASLVNSTEKYVGFVANTAEVLQNPALLKIIKGEEIVRQYASYLGISPILVRDELEFKQIEESMALQEAEAAKAEQMNMAAQTAKDFSGAEVTDNNVLGMIAQGG